MRTSGDNVDEAGRDEENQTNDEGWYDWGSSVSQSVAANQDIDCLSEWLGVHDRLLFVSFLYYLCISYTIWFEMQNYELDMLFSPEVMYTKRLNAHSQEAVSLF